MWHSRSAVIDLHMRNAAVSKLSDAHAHCREKVITFFRENLQFHYAFAKVVAVFLIF